MKKSVNGKTFDEIFEQRGKEVELNELVKGITYLNDSSLTDEGFGCYLFVFDSFMKSEGNFIQDGGFLSDSDIYQYDMEKGFSYTESDLFLKPHPTKLRYLNSINPNKNDTTRI